MADTIREQIIAAIVTKLADIRTAKGYNTNIGQNVQRVLKDVDPGELPATTVWPQPEASGRGYGHSQIVMPVNLNGLVAFGGVNASVKAEKILGDLIELMTSIRWTLPFTSGGAYTVVAGNTIEGQGSGAVALVEFVDLTGGAWGDENAAGNLTLRRLVGTFEAEDLDVGANANVATTSGVITGQDAPTVVTGGLVEDVEYSAGGVEDYPEAGHKDVGVPALFNIKYKTLAGDPYNQPS
ncbi:hypothetical protein LCGC14_0612830 [marine sediment metagenome]|uniref:Uncharacterized protein n=1 Tax=marine sediment metagenome TaxID=412755 RepID=A0A0F9RBZ9_9ZZZZ